MRTSLIPIIVVENWPAIEVRLARYILLARAVRRGRQKLPEAEVRVVMVIVSKFGMIAAVNCC